MSSINRVLRNLAAKKEQQQVHQPPSNNSSLSSYQATTLVNDSIYDKLRLLNNNHHHRHQSIREGCWPPRSPTSWYPHLPATPHHQDGADPAGNLPMSANLLSPSPLITIKEYSSLSPTSCKTSLTDELAKTTTALNKKGKFCFPFLQNFFIVFSIIFRKDLEIYKYVSKISINSTPTQV